MKRSCTAPPRSSIIQLTRAGQRRSTCFPGTITMEFHSPGLLGFRTRASFTSAFRDGCSVSSWPTWQDGLLPSRENSASYTNFDFAEAWAISLNAFDSRGSSFEDLNQRISLRKALPCEENNERAHHRLGSPSLPLFSGSREFNRTSIFSFWCSARICDFGHSERVSRER